VPARHPSHFKPEESRMIKISANISKKVPIPGTEFSSQQYGASMEI
jgi:hypothetical protein